MDVYACEDTAVDTLGPLVAARPACDLIIGGGSLVEMLGLFGKVHRLMRPHLQHYLTALGDSRVPLWGGPREVAQCVAPRPTNLVLLVNARLIPSRPQLICLRTLVEGGRPGIILVGSNVAAAIVQQDARTAKTLTAIRQGRQSLDTLADSDLPRFDATLELLQTPADLLTAHETSLEAMLAVALESGHYVEQRPGLFLENHDDPTLAPKVAAEIAVRQGPVLIDAAAEVGPFCCFDGPVRIGRRTKVHPHSWLAAGTVAGHDCRLGGEITATVIEPFSNKAHEGFLGHSHLGSWVNLAAGTITGNLKFSYGPVRLHGHGATPATETDRQFFGSLIGDFTKTAIQTALPCGGLIGPAATLGGVVSGSVPAFYTQLSATDQGTCTSVDLLATSLARMLSRRGLTFQPADRKLLHALAQLTNSSDTSPANNTSSGTSQESPSCVEP
jgi:hypothetical protein